MSNYGITKHCDMFPRVVHTYIVSLSASQLPEVGLGPRFLHPKAIEPKAVGPMYDASCQLV